MKSPVITNEEMDAHFNLVFKFPLGSMVYLKGAPHTPNTRPRKLSVVARYLMEHEPGVFTKEYALCPDLMSETHYRVIPENALTTEKPEFDPCTEQMEMTLEATLADDERDQTVKPYDQIAREILGDD